MLYIRESEPEVWSSYNMPIFRNRRKVGNRLRHQWGYYTIHEVVKRKDRPTRYQLWRSAKNMGDFATLESAKHAASVIEASR